MWNNRHLLIGLAVGAIAGSLLGLALAKLPTEPKAEQTYSEATVVRVIDGDTVELASGEKVRYLGIDTPETFGDEECGGSEATLLNRELVEGKDVWLLSGPEDTDRFGRLLRYVFVDETFVNAELVWQGYAQPQSFSAKEQFRQVLVQLGAAAEQAARGNWGRC